MKFKKTRIVVSVFFGILSLSLIGLWVRSYWWREAFEGVYEDRLMVCLIDYGTVEIWRSNGTVVGQPFKPATRFWSTEKADRIGRFNKIMGPHFVFRRNAICIPLWLPTLLAAAIAAAPWIHGLRYVRLPPFRFSLSTLLLVTTLIALALGYVIYFIRT